MTPPMTAPVSSPMRISATGLPGTVKASSESGSGAKDAVMRGTASAKRSARRDSTSTWLGTLSSATASKAMRGHGRTPAEKGRRATEY